MKEAVVYERTFERVLSLKTDLPPDAVEVLAAQLAREFREVHEMGPAARAARIRRVLHVAR